MDYIVHQGVAEWTDNLLGEIVKGQPANITSYAVDVLGKWLLASEAPDALMEATLQFTKLAVEAARAVQKRVVDLRTEKIHKFDETHRHERDVPYTEESIDKMIQACHMAEGVYCPVKHCTQYSVVVLTSGGV